MFTVEQRDALRDRLLRLAEADGRFVAGATVGSLTVGGGGDRFSDSDLTFGIANRVPVADVLDDWTRTLVDALDAVPLADLARGPTTYRVFLLPEALQLDLSMTPAAQFRPAGPRFRLLFGATAAGAASGLAPAPAAAGELFGWGVIYALHARARRARAGPASRALRRRRARPRARAGLPPPRAARGAGSPLRRPPRRDPGALRGGPRRHGRARGAARRPRRVSARSCARARRRGCPERRPSRSASPTCADAGLITPSTCS